MNMTFDKDAWRAEMDAGRADTKDYFVTQFDWRGTAIPEGFEGPRYFPLNEEWRKVAKLDRNAPGTGQHVELLTSIGDMRHFEIYGTFVFDHQGQEQRLTAFRMIPEPPGYDELFVPFKDATTGHETYGAGRYLDIPRHEDNDEYILDFNTAYNPLCAYTPRYNCPYPPPQNTLKVAVEAGEMVPINHETEGHPV
ncbi:MAG: DUF1684 domain-containing protein [Chloroflexota bacterium]